MASGDNARSWFPEMIEHLGVRWKESWNGVANWPEIIAFCVKMTDYREELRNKKNIRNPTRWCNKCQKYEEMRLAPLSPRSMFYILKKENFITDEKFNLIDKEWNIYKRKNKLDSTGNPV